MSQHDYKHLDEGPYASPFEISMTTREVAERIAALNYGVHRFLSHLIDVRRERRSARVQEHLDDGEYDLATALDAKRDELADELEKILARGVY